MDKITSDLTTWYSKIIERFLSYGEKFILVSHAKKKVVRIITSKTSNFKQKYNTYIKFNYISSQIHLISSFGIKHASNKSS